MERMTYDQTKQLLAIAATYDDRKPDRAQANAWHAALSDLPLEECRTAVITYYSHSHTRRVQPGDVRDMVTSSRADRLARSGWSTARPPVEADDIDAYQQWLRDGATTAAEDPPPARAIEPGTGQPSETVRPLLEDARRQCLTASSRLHSGHTRPTTPSPDDGDTPGPDKSTHDT